MPLYLYAYRLEAAGIGNSVLSIDYLSDHYSFHDLVLNHRFNSIIEDPLGTIKGVWDCKNAAADQCLFALL